MSESRSQLGQDEWVLQLTKHIKNKYFIEAGALDGLHLSNTLKLEQQGDWEGLCIEPSPSFHDLVKNRKCRVSDACLAQESGKQILFVHMADAPALSGNVDSLGQHFGGIETEIRLVSKTLSEVLDENDAPSVITYLSLDTEGSELEILRGVDFNRYKFSLMTVEHNYVEPRRSELRAFLHRAGYIRVRKRGWDDWYLYPPHFSRWTVANELLKEFWRKIRENLFSLEAIRHRLDRILPFRWGLVDLVRVLEEFKPRGVIHVGGHHGQEAGLYSQAGVAHVLWVEANPESFEVLNRNVRRYGHLTANFAGFSESGREMELKISSNSDGIASSLYSVGKEMERFFPTITMERTVKVRTIAIKDLLVQMGLDVRNYELLVLDVQGAELEVLKGMIPVLKNFKAIVAEVSRKELYRGAVQCKELTAFLAAHDFRSLVQLASPVHADVLFIRQHNRRTT